MFVSIKNSMAFPTQRPVAPAIVDKIGTVFQTFSDFTILCWYGIQYAFDFLLYTSPQTNFTCNEIIVSTTNHAKFTELNKYAKPTMALSERAVTAFKLHGFAISHRALVPKPFDDGKCLGGVVLFLTQWLQTQNVERTSQEFKGGIPYEGALYQEVYDACESLCHRKIVDWLTQFIDACLKNEISEASKITKEWASSKEYRGSLLLLQATGAFLVEGKDPSKGRLLEYVKTACEKKGQKLEKTLYASVREVADHYEKKGLSEIETIEVLLSFLGAKLSLTKNLNPGAYMLRFPVQSVRSHHVVGLINENDRTCTLYDPNHVIGRFPKKDLTQKIQQLLTEYGSHSFTSYRVYLNTTDQKQHP